MQCVQDSNGRNCPRLLILPPDLWMNRSFLYLIWHIPLNKTHTVTSFCSFFLECSNRRRRPLARRTCMQQDRKPQRLLRQSHYAVQISFLQSSQSKLQSFKSKTSPFCLPGQITVVQLVESQLTLLFWPVPVQNVDCVTNGHLQSALSSAEAPDGRVLNIYGQEASTVKAARKRPLRKRVQSE